MIRSLLFVPGNNPAMLQNADIHGADALILDLEDAVATREKDSARALVKRAIKGLDFAGIPLVIRINPAGSPYLDDDLVSMVPLAPQYLMPTKVSGAEDIQDLSRKMAEIEKKNGLEAGTVGLIPLIETALGVENAFQIAGSDPRVKGLFLGAEDLTSDLGAVRSKAGQEIFYARGRMVMAAKACGIPVYDTPSPMWMMKRACWRTPPSPKAWVLTAKPPSPPGMWPASTRCSAPRLRKSPTPGK